MLVTELGIVIEIKPVQREKQELPKLVTELGIVIEVKPLQLEKQWISKLVTTYIVPSTEIDAGIHISPVLEVDVTCAVLLLSSVM